MAKNIKRTEKYTVQIDCIIRLLLCTCKLNINRKRMGLWDFLLAGAIYDCHSTYDGMTTSISMKMDANGSIHG